MKRNEARELVMKLIFQYEIQKENFKDGHDMIIEEEDCESQEEYINDVFDNFIANREEIDSLISKHAENWPIYRLAKVDLAILRMSVCEMLFIEYIPTSVCINEAVKLAHKYSDVKSYKFINGILGKIAKSKGV